nr:hypothetical protein Iba_scaffold2406CG0210 [Ipomoea batatas]
MSMISASTEVRVRDLGAGPMSRRGVTSASAEVMASAEVTSAEVTVRDRASVLGRDDDGDLEDVPVRVPTEFSEA